MKVPLLHKAVVLVLVHPGYFISPVPTISGEPWEALVGRPATPHKVIMLEITIYIFTAMYT